MRHARELLHTPARKKRKRERRVRLALIAVAGLLVSGGVLSWVAHMGQVRIASIGVTGNDIVESEIIRSTAQAALAGNYAFIFPKDNTFLYPKDDILAALLASFPRIKNIKIDRDGLTKLSISVDERDPAAMWCGPSEDSVLAGLQAECYFLDDASFVYAQAPTFSNTSYLAVYGDLYASSTKEIIGEHYAPDEEFDSLIELRDVLARQNIKIIAYQKLENKDYRARLQEGGTILISLLQNPKDTAIAITSALETKKGTAENIDYMDARFLETGKVFVKFR